MPKGCKLLRMPPSRRTTLRDIAAAAGLHFATVSRALKNNPLIAPETRKRVRKIAEEMGYIPDPLLSALTSYRSEKARNGYRATLAWITNGFSSEGWDSCETFHRYYLGARERAASLGFGLEEFWLREPGMNWRRNSEILRARGITGLIIAPQPRPKMRIRLDWPHFSAVAIGYTTFSPHLHIVTNDQFHSMTTLVRQVRARGYRRIALWITRSGDERIDRGWTGGYLAQQQFWPEKDRQPILFFDTGLGLARAAEWIGQYRPDAILSDAHSMKLIQKAGYRVPEDIGVASFSSLNENPDNLCGIDENAFSTGAAAVDLLAGMMSRGERGIPKIHQRILIEGTWFEGMTLR